MPVRCVPYARHKIGTMCAHQGPSTSACHPHVDASNAKLLHAAVFVEQLVHTTSPAVRIHTHYEVRMRTLPDITIIIVSNRKGSVWLALFAECWEVQAKARTGLCEQCCTPHRLCCTPCRVVDSVPYIEFCEGPQLRAYKSARVCTSCEGLPAGCSYRSEAF